MFEQFTQYNDAGLLVLRLVLAVIFVYHGLPKLKNAKGMAQMVGMPAGMILGLGAMEVMASIGLVLGFYTQLSALVLAMVMVGAIYMKKMKWHVPFAATDKTGWEFDLILLAASLLILLNGGGTMGL